MPASSSRSAPTSLIKPETSIRVSSTLEKSLGKKHLTDGSNETCWTSTNGLPQSITLKFERPVQPSRVLLTFAGGFVGSATTLSSAPSSSASGSSSSSAQKDWRLRKRFFPDDSNRRQAFELAPDEAVEPEGSAELEGEQRQQSEDDGWAREWKIEFEKSSDFFGRITVYELEVWGWEMEGEEPQT